MSQLTGEQLIRGEKDSRQKREKDENGWTVLRLFPVSSPHLFHYERNGSMSSM